MVNRKTMSNILLLAGIHRNHGYEMKDLRRALRVIL